MNPNTRIFLDLEYCYPGMLPGTPRPTANDQRQIIQIAAIQYDLENQQEITAFDRLVIPTYMSQVTPFFTELTGISQRQIDETGIPLMAALDELRVFCDGYIVMTYDQDWHVIDQNCGYIHLPNPFSEFIRVKALLPHWGIDPNLYSSGTLYKAVAETMDGHVHNALHDVRSMAKAVSILQKRNTNNDQAAK